MPHATRPQCRPTNIPSTVAAAAAAAKYGELGKAAPTNQVSVCTVATCDGGLPVPTR